MSSSNVNPSPSLKKFVLHPPALLAPNAPLIQAYSTITPFSPTSLNALRTTLLASRTLAAERIIVKDTNRRNLGERQALLNRVIEGEKRVKEVERKKRKEEDDRREKEKRAEREVELAEQSRVAALAAATALNTTHDAEMNGAGSSTSGGLSRMNSAQSIASKPGSAPNGTPLQTTTSTPTPSILHFVPAVVTHAIPGLLASSSAHPSPAPSTILDTTDDDVESGQPKPPSRRRSVLDKKKRKREQVVESDNSGEEGGAEKHRKTELRKMSSLLPSPSPVAGGGSITFTSSNGLLAPKLSALRRALKSDAFTKHSIPTRAPPYGTASTFFLPSSTLLVPTPPISIPNTPTPKRQSEVSEDFSKAKPGTQIAFHIFHQWAENYLRPFGEDDLAFLARRTDDQAAFIVPPLGKYYQERWEEEDLELSHSHASHHNSITHYLSPSVPPPLVRVRPEHLTEDSMGMENIYVGPLTERLVAALAFTGEEAESSMTDSRLFDLSGGPGAVAPENGDEVVDEETARHRSELDAVELEERIKAELRFIGILPTEEVDWNARADDPVSSALRACQAELATQVSLNNQRKTILSSIVADRIGYQEYETTRDAQERIIEAGWTKRQKNAGSGKQKSKKKEMRAIREDPLGFGGDGSKMPISLGLLNALVKREKLVGVFKPFFEESARRFYGVPEQSVFADVVNLEDEE